MNAIKKGLREPLLHFLLLGAALFGAYHLVGDRPERTGSPDRILVTLDDIDRLAVTFSRTWQRPPTRQEMEGLVDEYVKEEVLYREALKFGLDRDDTIVRRRMRQKMEFLSDDLSEQPDPTVEELQAFLDEHASEFAVEPRLSFQHVYFSSERWGDSARGKAQRVLEALADGSVTGEDVASRGDRLWWPSEIPLATVHEIGRQFGQDFASKLVGIEPGKWVGPVESEFGFHVVRISERIEERVPELSEVRRAVEREFKFVRRNELQETFYRELRDRYAVTVQWPETNPEETVMGALK